MNNYLIIKVENINKERFITKLHKLNIDIYDVKKNNNILYFKIKESDYEKIQKYLKMYDITKYQHIGINNIKNKLKKYNILIVSLIIGIITIIFSSFFIVDIQIMHEDQKLVNLIKNELEENGIKKFTIKKSYNKLENIKKKIKNNHLDQIDWLEIETHGMKYIIKVEKRIIKNKEKNKNYCNIYAKKDGLIKKIKVFSGDLIVNINDYVKKDDLLISGDIKLNEEIKNRVCADGKVYAEVWYTVNIKLPYQYYEERKTGKKRLNFILGINDIEYKILKDRLNNFKSEKKEIFNALGIKIYKVIDEEIEKTKKIYTEEEIEKEALKIAVDKLKLKLEKDEEIINQKVLQKRQIDSTMDIDIFIVALEQIGYSKEDVLNDS